jgi:imidazolonepropionase
VLLVPRLRVDAALDALDSPVEDPDPHAIRPTRRQQRRTHPQRTGLYHVRTMHCDRVWHNARLLTLARGRERLGAIDRGVVAARDGRIAYAGEVARAPPGLTAAHTIDCEGRWITPGLIDCHTHLVHAGDRAHEFERRLAGDTYEQIAREGGGILSTVRATRAATETQLVDASLPRLDALIAEGVTTVEVKSGYGLDQATELKLLSAAQRLARVRRIDVSTTLLAAHAVPPEYAGRADAYVDQICNAMIPAAASGCLADAVDAYCETIGFTAEQTARVFAAAREAGLRVKLHADQLSDTGGAALAARFEALSADHLEHASESGLRAMAAARTVAVLLPGAWYFLRDAHAPPVALLREHGVAIALATDCNPGTSPLTSILLAMNMGATLFRLTVDECIAGVTREAARALGRLDETGTLETGKLCNLAIWNVDRPAELVYRIGFNPLHSRIWRGE